MRARGKRGKESERGERKGYGWRLENRGILGLRNRSNQIKSERKPQ